MSEQKTTLKIGVGGVIFFIIMLIATFWAVAQVPHNGDGDITLLGGIILVGGIVVSVAVYRGFTNQ